MGIERFIPVSIISIDINNLKDLNDTYGHHPGDQFIKDTPKILRPLVRKFDFLARIGGAEFFTILPNTLPGIAESRKQKLVKKIEAFNKKNENTPIIIAVGTTSTRDIENCIGKTLKRADKNMYAQKREMKLTDLYPA